MSGTPEPPLRRWSVRGRLWALLKVLTWSLVAGLLLGLGASLVLRLFIAAVTGHAVLVTAT